MKFTTRDIFVGFIFLCVLALLIFFTIVKIQEIKDRKYVLARLAKQLNDTSASNWCDELVAKRRVALSKILDMYGQDIKKLWQTRKQGGNSKENLIRLGTIYLRKSAPEIQKYEIENSSWSWEEANNVLIRIQNNLQDKENKDRWRDFDTMVRFMLEKDILRIVRKLSFLPREKTVHQFRIEKTIKRKSKNEYLVSLNPGEFDKDKELLKELIENGWKSFGKKIRIEWVNDADSYKVVSNLNSSRSFVNHKKRIMVIANLASVKTVVHEFGHVLGFDDHYYTSWNNENCYYMQESRLEDVMSSSEKGSVTKTHWKILEKAYPLDGTVSANFSYFYQDF
ncbi:MAG: hypothetical protein M9962_05505 [Oligoflexia bacterium]|nr:hypothetical protein [Oligoflexia bacterium]